MALNLWTFLLTGHGSSGKTTLAESFLFKSGVTKRLGIPNKGTSILDYDEEEIERGISINLSVAKFQFKNNLFYVIDTPGFIDFQGEILSALTVSDGAILVVDSSSGIEVGTELYGQMVFDRKIPCMVFITKMKADNANPDNILENLKKSFEGKSFFPLQFPEGKGETFKGVVSIFDKNVPEHFKSLKERSIESIVELSEELVSRYLEGEEIKEEELKNVLKQGVINGHIVPVLLGDAIEGIGIEELLQAITEYFPRVGEITFKKVTDKGEEILLYPDPKKTLVSYIFKTMSDPHLGEIYYTRVFQGTLHAGSELFNSSTQTKEKINQVYELCGKERKEVEYIGPGEIGALVKLKNTFSFNTLCSGNNSLVLEKVEFPGSSISTAIVPKTKQDEEKVMEAMAKIKLEDPTFNFYYDPELKQRIVEGLGEIHLKVILSKMKRRFGVDVLTEKTKIPYRETIRKSSDAMGKYVKQSGGRGQYGICYIKIEPRKRGEGYKFINDIFGGAIPSNFIPSVETGIKKAMEKGVLAGYPVVDVEITLYDGKYHPVDSSNIAFEIAGGMAFRDAQEKAEPYLLEPIYEVKVIVPDEVMGDVIGDLNARRGKILGIAPIGKKQKISALVPLAEMSEYSNTLRSITKGKGTFTMKFSYYEEVPPEISRRIIQESKREQEKK